jgi:hypothetical protein
MSNELITILKEMYSLDELKNIAQYGCVSGAASQHISYHQTIDFYDKYRLQIWELINNESEEYGYTNIISFLNDLNGSDQVSSEDTFKNLLSWLAVETIATDIIDAIEE